MSKTSVSETKTGIESRANDCSISVWKAQVGAALLVFPVVFVCVLPYLILWGNNALDGTLDSVHGGVLMGLFIGGIVVHEVLHGIGWALAGGRGWTAISFGFKLKSLTPYAHVEGPMEAWAYRVGAALPGVTLGLFAVGYRPSDRGWGVARVGRGVHCDRRGGRHGAVALARRAGRHSR